MPTSGKHHLVEVSDDTGRVVSAEVFVEDEVDVSTGDTVRTVHAVMERQAGHVAPGARGRLVDAVLLTSEVHDSARLRASVPLGDSETLFRFAEVFADATLHAAGTTVLVEADLADSGGTAP